MNDCEQLQAENKELRSEVMLLRMTVQNVLDWYRAWIKVNEKYGIDHGKRPGEQTDITSAVRRTTVPRQTPEASDL